MRRAEVSMHGVPAGILEELASGGKFRFTYLENYRGPAVSLTLPVEKKNLSLIAFHRISMVFCRKESFLKVF